MTRWTYGLMLVAVVICAVLIWPTGYERPDRAWRSGAHAVDDEPHRPSPLPNNEPGISVDVTGPPDQTYDETYWVTQVVREN
jgi:hypothetical protein